MSTIICRESLTYNKNDKTKSYNKEFNVDELEIILNNGIYDKRELYEVINSGEEDISTKMVKPYFDLDVKPVEIRENGKKNGKVISTNPLISKEEFNIIYNNAIDFIETQFGVNYEDDLCISTAHLKDQKWSCHIIIRNQKCSIQSLINWKDTNLDKLNELNLDTSVYAKGVRCFRMIRSSKKGKGNTLVPIDDVFPLKDHFVTNVNDDMKVISFESQKKAKKEVTRELQKARDDIIVMVNTNKDIMDLKSILDKLDFNRCDNYSDWIKIGYIIKQYGSYTQFRDFSKQSSKFDENQCADQWNKLNPNGDLSLSSLYYFVYEDYYKPLIEIIRKNDCDHLNAKVFKYIVDKIKTIRLVTSGKDEWYLYQNKKWELDQNCCSYTLYHIINLYVIDEIKKLVTIFYSRNKQIVDGEETSDSHETIECVNSLTKKISTIGYSFQSNKSISSSGKLIFPMFYINNFINKFDQEPYLVKCKDKIINVKTMEITEMSPDYLLTAQTNVEFQHFESDDPIMIEFIQLFEQILCQKKEYGVDGKFEIDQMVTFVLFLFGSYILGIKSRELFQYWFGIGRNGKTLLIKFLKLVMGSYFAVGNNCLIDSTQRLDNEYLNALKKARLVVFNELSKNAKIRSGLVKSIVGNDDLNSRGIFQKESTWKPNCNLLFIANSKIDADSTDEALFARIEMIEFKSRFVKNPRDYNEFLINEEFDLEKFKEVGLYTIIRFSNALIEQNFKIEVPEEVSKQTQEYRSSSDIYGKWFKENYESVCDDLQVVKVNDLWNQFKLADRFDKKIHTKDDLIKSLKGNGYRYHDRYQPIINGIQQAFRSCFVGIKKINDDQECEL